MMTIVASPLAAAEASGQFSMSFIPLPAAPGGAAQHRLEKQFSGALAGTVVPGSGTGALAGIGGRMIIRIKNQQHCYTLSYVLPAAP